MDKVDSAPQQVYRPWRYTMNEVMIQVVMVVWAYLVLKLAFSTHDSRRWGYFWFMSVVEVLMLIFCGFDVAEAWINYFKSKNKTSSAQ